MQALEQNLSFPFQIGTYACTHNVSGQHLSLMAPTLTALGKQLLKCDIINNFLLVSEYYFGCKNKCLFSYKVHWDGTYPHNTLNHSTLLPFPPTLADNREKHTQIQNEIINELYLGFL